MRSELLLIEKIELYIDGKLSPEETAIFENQLSEDASLREEVTLQRQIMGGIQRSLVKKELATAFIKYKTIALLWKLGVIGSGVITATIGIILLYNYLNTTAETTSPSTSEKPQLKTVLETKDTTLGFHTDSIIPVSLSTISEAGTNSYTPDKTATIKEEKPVSIKGVSSVDTTIKNETSAPKPVVVSSETRKNSSAVKNLSEKKKEQQLSTFFINPNAPVTWLGIDFTKAQFLDKDGNLKDGNNEQNEKISGAYFKEWNELIIAEKKRYDISGALRHEKITFTTDHINNMNDTIQIERLFVPDNSILNHLNSDDIQNLVNTYPLNEKQQGYGLVFIVESLDRQKKETNTWVTLIDIKSKQVLITEKMRANANGLGMRNFWARGFHNTINDLKERKYPEWQSKYKK